MNKTKIEWCNYTINPVKGLCPMACPYCYARRMYKRFKWNPNIRADWQETGKVPNKPSLIFVGSTMELFGDWVKPEWMNEIMQMPQRYPQHTFIFLTKQPQNLIKWSPFPQNCWVGVSATDNSQYETAWRQLRMIKAKVKYISFEPLLDRIESLPFRDFQYPKDMIDRPTDWIIIGAQTPSNQRTVPKIEWVKEIIVACDKAGIPVFLKNNLLPLFPMHKELKQPLRQEFPL